MSSTGKTTKRKTTPSAAPRSAKPAAKRVAKPAVPAAPRFTHGEIAGRAYELYARSGYQPGREVEFWLEAERQLQRGRKR
jgi:hypothetical protein